MSELFLQINPKEITKVRYYSKEETLLADFYKGGTKVWDLNLSLFPKRIYEDMIIGRWYKAVGEKEIKELLEKKHWEIVDGKVYYKPHIQIDFSDGSTNTFYFENEEKMLNDERLKAITKDFLTIKD